MTSTLLPPPFPARRSRPRKADRPLPVERVHERRERSACIRARALGGYIDRQGRPRQVIALPGSVGSVLVVDRDAATLGDRRLVAHLGADEPAQNAAFVCRLYLQEAPGRDWRCRPLVAEDLCSPPFTEAAEPETVPESLQHHDEPLDERGRRYRLELLRTGMSIPELRWRRHAPAPSRAAPSTVSVREATAALESYEPVRTLTLATLARHRDDGRVSTAVLRAESERLAESPIVLNRGLRETVLATIEREGLSMSEIAIRCGRVKRDSRGCESGETSWLARRLGMLPEGGRNTPTPWIHSDVLALIARRGLGVSPREVEL